MQAVKTKTAKNSRIKAGTGLIHPKILIDQLCALSALNLYGVEWLANAGPQLKDIKGGHHQHIDYAAPCFELANLLKQSPSKVGASLAAEINQSPSELFKVESVSGYLNFELSDDFIKHSAKGAVMILRKKPSLIPGRAVEVLVYGYPVNKAKDKQLRLAQGLFNQVYSLAGYQVTGSYLIADCSKPALDLLASLYSKNQAGIPNNAQLLKQLASFRVKKTKDPAAAALALNTALALSNQPPRAALPAGSKKNQAEFLDYLKNRPGIASEYSRVLAESELSGKVHHWLDGLIGRPQKPKAFVGDGQNQAVYYQLPSGVPVSIRSASGVLFEPAFLLYYLDQKIAQIQKSTKQRIVIIAPKSFHELLGCYVARNIRPALANNFICLDPNKAYRSIFDHHLLGKPITGVFRQIARNLAGGVAQPTSLEDKQQRRAMVAAINFSADFFQKSATPHHFLELISEIQATSERAKTIAA